jgi:hypothetical protein
VREMQAYGLDPGNMQDVERYYGLKRQPAAQINLRSEGPIPPGYRAERDPSRSPAARWQRKRRRPPSRPRRRPSSVRRPPTS